MTMFGKSVANGLLGT